MAPARTLGPLVLVAALACGSCAGDGGIPTGVGTTAAGAGATAAHLAPRVVEYLPGLDVELRVPASADERTPVAVLVPGGAWQTADPTGLRPLADRLTAWGAVTATITMRAGEDGVTFPTPVGDVLCAAALAHQQAVHVGAAGPLVLVGHSSGAHLAMVAALAPDHFADPSCPYPPIAPDAVVGLAGIYDLAAVPDIADALMGASPAEAPDRWAEASATTWVGERPSLPVLLARGDADTLVPASFLTAFAGQLRRSGHPVEVRVVPGADHHSIYAAAVIGPTIEAWLAGLSG